VCGAKNLFLKNQHVLYPVHTQSRSFARKCVPKPEFGNESGLFCDCQWKIGNKMKYTCTEYRTEMILLGLKMRLNQKDLTDEEKAEILSEIRKLEEKMGLRN
jgi:hypothetical protein